MEIAIESLNESTISRLRKMVKKSAVEAQNIEERYQNIPSDYIYILENYGWGGLLDSSGDFEIPIVTIFNEPESAIYQTYKDTEILKHGARGDIIIVASEFDGTAYGFDRNLNWALSRVETNREVEHLKMTFSELFFSFLACDADIIHTFENGCWVGIDGDRYAVSSILK